MIKSSNTPRFQTRFSNGFWKTFDTVTYSSWATHHTKADADIAVARINTSKEFK